MSKLNDSTLKILKKYKPDTNMSVFGNENKLNEVINLMDNSSQKTNEIVIKNTSLGSSIEKIFSSPNKIQKLIFKPVSDIKSTQGSFIISSSGGNLNTFTPIETREETIFDVSEFSFYPTNIDYVYKNINFICCYNGLVISLVIDHDTKACYVRSHSHNYYNAAGTDYMNLFANKILNISDEQMEYIKIVEV